MSTTVTIGRTAKGARVWLQGVSNPHGRYSVHYGDSGTMYIYFGPDHKRKLCAAKGGIVDVVGKRVSQWAGDATQAVVTHGPDVIAIKPVQE